MIVGLARVSTPKDEQRHSYESQISRLEASGCDLVLAEKASGYLGKKRPAWDEIWSLLGSGVVTEIRVIDQSRLTKYTCFSRRN